MQCPKCGKESKIETVYGERIEWEGNWQVRVPTKSKRDTSLHSESRMSVGLGCFFWPLVILLSVVLWVGTTNLFGLVFPPIAAFLLVKWVFHALKIKKDGYQRVDTWRCKYCGYTQRDIEVMDSY